ncbi:hypothetical protein AERYTH_06270 [Aeromicrobium erythreum]|uniref:Coenzyme Q-binding protein COQ10 START domain-containing protein n=1 Tax=Aeromicrobium erythreum TaxID=2041 RepID=A0A0U3KH75_9ACTN|nr:hypothetical protein AERYTH_06270 [Aeromicrobium erythreum]
MRAPRPWGHRGPGTVDEERHLRVPVRTAYDRWTQYESFPRFARHVHRVEQVRPAVTRWFVRLGPLRHEFHAEVVEQHPDTLVAWHTLGSRVVHEGEATFRATGPDTCVVTLTLRVPCPPVVPRRAAEALLRPIVSAELDRFRTFVETVGDVGEAWRGTIHRGRVEHVEKEPPAHPGWVHG